MKQRQNPRAAFAKRRKKKQHRRILLSAMAILLFLILAAGGLFYLHKKNDTPKSEEPEISEDPNFLDRLSYPVAYTDLVASAAETYRLEEALIYAVILTESSFRAEVVSHAGAVGLMQIMPDTYSWLCEKRGMTETPEKLTDPALNIDFGAYYLRLLLDYYDGSLSNALLAYNAGIGRVNSWLEDEQLPRDGVLASVPIEETENYLVKVTYAMDAYQRIYKGDYHND